MVALLISVLLSEGSLPPSVQVFSRTGGDHYQVIIIVHYRKVSNIRRTLVGNKIVDH